MGSAGVAVVDDTDAVALNPAGIALVGTTRATNEVSASYANLLVGLDGDARISQSYLAFAQSHPERGGVGVAWYRADVGSLYTEDRVGVGLATRTRLGKGDANRKRLAVGLRAELLKWDSAPTVSTSGGVLENLEGPTRVAFATGAIVALSPSVFFGTVFNHINEPDIASKASVVPERLPTQVVLGLGARGTRFLWGFDILLERQQVDVRTGLEWEVIPKTLTVRGGFRLEGLGLGNNLTFGVGVRPNATTRFDYAFWLPVGTVQETLGSHRIGVVYAF
jgi:hypothetical protein